MRALTIRILASGVVALAGYDVLAYQQSGTPATISAVVRDLVGDWPIAGVAIGTILGHIFWPLTPREQK